MGNAISDNQELWQRVVINLVLSLIGRISSSIRGVSLDFDGETIAITAYFDADPSERDVENMQDIEAELVSHHEYQSALNLVTIESESLLGRQGNWGWVFLRDDG